MRGRRRTRAERLHKAGWQVLQEHKSTSGKHRLILRHHHGHANVRSEEDPRGVDVEIEAVTRPRAYLEAERRLLQKQGRDIRPRLP